MVATDEAGQPGRRDRDQFIAEIPQHREQRAEMNRDVERQPLVGPAEKTRHQYQVRGTRDLQELGDALDQGENKGLQQIHA